MQINSTDEYVFRSIKDHEDYPDIIVIMCLLALFSVTGTVGNVFVLYVFGKKRDKSTTTIFILTLAGTDFFTCLIIVPYTIVSEYYAKVIYNDTICKVYHFLITSNVPFSFFIMVAIAFDRYFKICRPWTRSMDATVAKRIIFGLIIFAISLGIIPALSSGTYEGPHKSLVLSDESENFTNESVSLVGNSSSVHYDVPQITTLHPDLNFSTTKSTFVSEPTSQQTTTKRKGTCTTTNKFISRKYLMVFQKFYASLFLIAFILVVILYGLIFRFITVRRAKKLNNKLLNNGTSETKSTQVARPCLVTTDVKASENGKAETVTSECLVTGGSEFNLKQRKRKKSVREKQRIANVKTAGILSTVTAVFIVSFLPAWLMVTGILPANIILFYMYFFYNVANPFIYAFFNRTFRLEVQKAVHCQRSIF